MAARCSGVATCQSPPCFADEVLVLVLPGRELIRPPACASVACVVGLRDEAKVGREPGRCTGEIVLRACL